MSMGCALGEGRDIAFSIFIARMLALVYLAAAIRSFCGREHFRRIAEQLWESPALSYLAGFAAVALGSAIVYYGYWGLGAPALVWLAGLGALIKGLLIIAFPGWMRQISEPFLTDRALKIIPYALLGAGLLFGYVGFAP